MGLEEIKHFISTIIKSGVSEVKVETKKIKIRVKTEKTE